MPNVRPKVLRTCVKKDTLVHSIPILHSKKLKRYINTVNSYTFVDFTVTSKNWIPTNGITKGSGEGQRIGHSIKLHYLIIRYALYPAGYRTTANTYNAPVTISQHEVCFRIHQPLSKPLTADGDYGSLLVAPIPSHLTDMILEHTEIVGGQTLIPGSTVENPNTKTGIMIIKPLPGRNIVTWDEANNPVKNHIGIHITNSVTDNEIAPRMVWSWELGYSDV